MPEFGAYRQICDYDPDWYTFSLSRPQNLRVDVLFTDAEGDIDIELFNADTNTRLVSSLGVEDNEVIELEGASPGNYAVRVYGVGSQTNSYRIFYSSGTLQTADLDDNSDYDVPDGGAMPGVYTTEAMTFPNIPQGSVVKSLTIQQLDINHRCVGDLEVTLLWDGQPIKTIWNRDGNNCTDGGLDDSGFSIGCFADTIFTRDICFENREYSEFAGLDAQGELSVEIKDFVSGNSGTLVNMQFDLQYYIP
jgi:subtilisin-like proprotein convertase family protein